MWPVVLKDVILRKYCETACCEHLEHAEQSCACAETSDFASAAHLRSEAPHEDNDQTYDHRPLSACARRKCSLRVSKVKADQSTYRPASGSTSLSIAASLPGTRNSRDVEPGSSRKESHSLSVGEMSKRRKARVSASVGVTLTEQSELTL